MTLPLKEELLRLLKPNMIVHHFDDNGVRSVRLKEDKEPKCFVDLTYIPDDALVIRADRFPAPSRVFKEINKCCCRADFILISQSAKKVVFIELKCGKRYKKQHVEAQLRGAACVIEYCQSILHWFLGVSNTLSEYERRFVCLVKEAKREPTAKKLEPNLKPEKARYLFRKTKAVFGSMTSN